MTQAQDDRYQELKQRLQKAGEAGDAAIVRALAIADELHRQSNERIDRLTERLDRLALLVTQSIENANADRASGSIC